MWHFIRYPSILCVVNGQTWGRFICLGFLWKLLIDPVIINAIIVLNYNEELSIINKNIYNKKRCRMPRQARVKSITGIYHIMLRGIDKRDIFLDNEDKLKFLESIEKAKEKGKFNVLGFCLMDNHVHMLLKEYEEIGTSIKRITVGYVGWHNKKHDRTGHLFQNRYMSEPVNTEEYLVTVLRYIHQNPVKARIVTSVKDYKWSSYGFYYLFYNGQKTIIDGTLIENYFGTFEEFSRYMNTVNDDECLEAKTVKHNTDNKLTKIITDKYKVINLPELPFDKKKAIIKDIYIMENTSIRQLSRVFGMGKSIVEKVLKKDE